MRRRPPKSSAQAAAAPTSRGTLDSSVAPHDFSRREKLTLATILLAAYAVVATWGQFDFSNIMGYYDLFADAVLQGHLTLDYTPDQVNLVDMIPYQGKYHFQWGPFPAVFHLPFRALGLSLSDRVASLLAGWLSTLLFFEILLMLRRRFFADLPKWVCRWFFFAFGLGLPTALLVYRGTVYNEVIAIGGLLILGAFFAFLRYEENLLGRWVAVAGVCLGLAVLTRITLVLYAPWLFLGVAGVLWLRGKSWRFALPHLVWLAAPIALAGLGQLGFNQARFGSPWTYGQEYKPGPTSGRTPFQLQRIPENVRHYLLSVPKVSADFPYIEHAGWPPVELTTRAEAISSLLLCYPFLLLTALAWPVVRGRTDAAPGLRLWTAVAGCSGGMVFFSMLCFVAASRRYTHDFLPVVFLTAFVGVGMAWRPALSQGRWRIAAWTVLVFSAIINAQVAFYQSFHTPTPDLNVMRTFVAVSPLVRQVLPGERLDREEAMARHDLATLDLHQKRYAEAAAQLERAAVLLPAEPRIRQNLEAARRLAGLPPR